MINEHDIVTLAVDKPEYGLYKGDKGTVINIYIQPPGYCLEINQGSKSPIILDLPPSDIEER
jgi:hypothetical protein